MSDKKKLFPLNFPQKSMGLSPFCSKFKKQLLFMSGFTKMSLTSTCRISASQLPAVGKWSSSSSF